MTANFPPARFAAVASWIAMAVCGAVVAPAFAHCDTMDGPVVTDAKTALERGDVTGVLKWVKNADEAEVRGVFDKVMTVRAKGRDAMELADMYFFETAVRLHLASEGRPYTGLKPGGADLGPVVTEGERSLVTSDVEPLVKLVTDAVTEGIRQRHAQAMQAREHVQDSVEAGRAFVAAYREFLHYAERLMQAAAGEGEAQGPQKGGAAAAQGEAPAPPAAEEAELEE